MAGQVLRMNVNGRLTAPPQFEAVLVTNSVCSIVRQGTGIQPKARGTTLDTSPLGTNRQSRLQRGYTPVGGRVGTERSLQTPRQSAPVSATQFPSASREAAAAS